MQLRDLTKIHVGWVVMRNGKPLNQSVYRVKSRARMMATRYGLTYDDVHEAFIGAETK
ncbi:hypothetical protein [Bradyrhizobium lupini]|uniref:hypothetical protein n=1 Tax=Rhizobium lupini TaxID=136996 RepID=UPI0034C63F10